MTQEPTDHLPLLAEIIAAGTELTNGAKLDTNSQWLSRELTDDGLDVRWHTTVSDQLADVISALRIAVQRVDVVLLTGGLGPTLDDLTREAVAELCGVPLVCDAESLAAIEGYFRQRQRPMPERNRSQAMFPQGAVPLVNPVGTAPGLWIDIPRHDGKICRVAAMPGVPSEMYRMFRDQVRPRLPATGLRIERHRINCFGVGESQAEEMLGDLTARGRDPEIGITAHDATITLRIVARGDSAAECQHKIAESAAAIRQRLGTYVFGTEDDELEDVVLRSLLVSQQTLAVVECGTQGALNQMLTTAAAAEQVFRGGLVLPNAAACEQWLEYRTTDLRSVDAGRVESKDARDGPKVRRTSSGVSAIALAEAVRQQFDADWGIGIAPFPAGTRAELSRSEARATFAIACREKPTVDFQTSLAGNPAILNVRLSKTTLLQLRQLLNDPCLT